MIRDWRNAWGEGDFPFLFVQIANWNTAPEALWPEVRDAQRQALVLKNTGMAVTIDIGDAVDLHPKDKQDVGLRLALAARAIAFGEKDRMVWATCPPGHAGGACATRLVRSCERTDGEGRGTYRL